MTNKNIRNSKRRKRKINLKKKSIFFEFFEKSKYFFKNITFKKFTFNNLKFTNFKSFLELNLPILEITLFYFVALLQLFFSMPMIMQYSNFTQGNFDLFIFFSKFIPFGQFFLQNQEILAINPTLKFILEYFFLSLILNPLSKGYLNIDIKVKFYISLLLVIEISQGIIFAILELLGDIEFFDIIFYNSFIEMIFYSIYFYFWYSIYVYFYIYSFSKKYPRFKQFPFFQSIIDSISFSLKIISKNDKENN